MKETTFSKEMSWKNFVTRFLLSSGALSTALALSLYSNEPTPPAEVHALGYEPTAEVVSVTPEADRLRQLICSIFANPNMPVTPAARQFAQFTVGADNQQIEVAVDQTDPTLIAGVFAEHTDGTEVLIPFYEPLDLENCDTE